ncbi:MAG: protein-ADP-ribose hydrolase [Anaerostipes sp.]|jgi:O-acetyl-ADP-ribose deacetylase (regulator of RNase III)
MNQSERRNYLLRELIKEDGRYSDIEIPDSSEEQMRLLRGLMNIRMPKSIDDEFLRIQNEFLLEESSKKGITRIDDLESVQEGIYLWQGDITTLKCGAIVNAANSGMTGCYVPNHHCIDNCIHFYSGVQLRYQCAEIMEKQGYAEPTGQAKITQAYNLPCDYIIHTVGPIVSGTLTQKDCDLLKSCYESCLKLAEEKGISSIAFCCISTGEFHFSNEEAAKIAVHTVKEFLKRNTKVKKVVFNVFKDMDKEIYEQLLR